MDKSPLENILELLEKYYEGMNTPDGEDHIYEALIHLESAVRKERAFDRDEWERGERDYWVELKRHDNDNET